MGVNRSSSDAGAAREVSGVVITVEPADSATAVALARRYAAEVEGRIPGVGDVQAAPAAEGLAPPHGCFFVAWDGNAAVACGGIRRLDADTAEIKRMWVAPSHRGRGVGRRLLARLEHHAAAEGATRMVLDTHHVLHEATALYASCGYEAVAAYNDNTDATLWFAKDLDGDARESDPPASD